MLKEYIKEIGLEVPEIGEKRLQDLLMGLKVCIEWERRNSKISLEKYVDVVNYIVNPPIKYTPCEGCGGKMKSMHNGFQNYIWRNLNEIDNKYIIPVPKFNSLRFQSNYWIESVKIMNFEDLKNNQRICLNDASRMGNIKNTIAQSNYILDANLFEQYKMSKLAYFEYYIQHFVPTNTTNIVENTEKTKQKIKKQSNIDVNIEEFVLLLEQGKSLKECSDILGISTRILTNVKKQLKK